MKNASVWIRAGIAIGIIGLAFIALRQGTPDLTALGYVLMAGAALIASITKVEK